MSTKSPLLDWVASHEANVTVAKDLVNPVSSVAAFGEDDRSIVARCELQPGTELVTLQAGAFLNGSSWLEHYDGEDKAKLQEQIGSLQLSYTVKTTLALLAELAHDEKSDFHGYVQQLPTAISLPFSWEGEIREMLKHTTAHPILDDKLVLNMYSDYAAPLMKQFPTIWAAEVSTLEKFQWAYSMVSSRAFKVADSQEPTLLPVIDMANHAAENPAAHIVKTETGSFQLVTLRKVEKDESVTISYGDLSNAQLLCRYGFVLPTPVPSDFIHITSSELTNAFKVCSLNSEDEGDDGDADDVPQVGNGKGKGKAKAKANPAKRRKLAHSDDDDNSLFFLLHGDAEREFGLGEALLSFVMASQLPAEHLYDVLAVVLQEKDKRYSDVVSAYSDKPSCEMNAIQQLSQHERQVCRRILLGLMSLEEGSDSSDDEE
ncbi:Ribosomal N-lysine methyltransferase set10 [Phytophthora cinnamomi]|uniref:Ribosomal N-lysine methyltransferase set10 n=1 Tax=Phytophthora cinnamomi TaxID=4785 RepID=UPI00355A01ED|nr:Ribosomal N-lysine methyltransferase set10 [Phytophthora cinnamomi]